jgi:hypothetical protein
MKVPNLRILAVGVVSLAMAAGVTTTAAAASAATTQGTHVAAAAPAAKAPGTITSSVTGTFTNADGPGTFVGTFTPQKFSVVNGVLDATGVLKGTMTSADGTSLGTVSKTITAPVVTSGSTANAPAAAAVACNVLNLTLGPLNLNLLGLVVTLNQIHLTITAVPGAGNLLGNLLCDVAGLLDGGLGGLLGQISLLLNSILALL